MSRAWTPFYMADFVADIAHLSNAEVGSYVLLLMHYYLKSGLPDDDDRLSRIAKASPQEWLCMRETIKEFFHSSWKHKRVEEELAKSIDLSEKRRAGASKRWENARAKAYAHGDANAHAKGIVRARALQPQPHIKDSLNGE